MGKLQIALSCKTVTVCVLLTLLLSGCYSNTAQYFGNATDTSMKMEHNTTILNAETQQLLESMVKSLSEVNFEYEVITTQ
jgi:uncharacterized protein YcfL